MKEEKESPFTGGGGNTQGERVHLLWGGGERERIHRERESPFTVGGKERERINNKPDFFSDVFM